MKYGICCPIDDIALAESVGFDYIEPNASATAALSDEEFEQKKELVAAAGIKCECFNVLFPSTITLLGKDASDWSVVEAHLHKVFTRVTAFGGELCVFGSGGPRKCPPDLIFFDAHRQLAEITAKIGKIAANYGVTIAVEPLNHTETNTINTLPEGAMLVAQVNMENVKLLTDGFHMFTDDEPLDNIKRAGAFAHVHIATKEGRRYPMRKDEMLTEFFANLCEIDYDARISIEGSTENFVDDGKKALALLKEITYIT